MFVDGTSILIFNNNYEEVSRILNDILHNTIEWFQVKHLVLNIEKNKTVKFIPANPSSSSLWIISGENCLS
jgi:hypothetical protein